MSLLKWCCKGRKKITTQYTPIEPQQIKTAQIIEINKAKEETLLVARLVSALKLSYMECFESNMDPTKMEWQIDAVIRVILSQCYHLGHKHDIRGLEKRLQYALLR